MPVRRAWPLLVCLFTLAPPAGVSAHGSFPQSEALAFPDAGPPLVLASFGLLVPEADGTWRWICEEVAGSGAIVTQLVALPGGPTLLGSSRGLHASEDHCRWSRVPGLEEVGISQLLVDPDVAGRVWAVALDAAAPLWVSDDAGGSFEVFPLPPLPEGAEVYTVVLQDGPRLLTGVLDGVATAWWREAEALHPVPIEGGEGQALYGLAARAGGGAWGVLRSGLGDALLILHPVDAPIVALPADTFRDFYSAFATGPAEAEVWVGGRISGLFHSTNDGASWGAPETSPQAGCLTRARGETWRCTDNYADGASVIRYSSSAADSSPVLRFADVVAPLDCPAGSPVADVCVPLWPLVQVYGLGTQTPTPTQASTPTSPGGDCGGCDEEGAAWVWLGIVGGRRRRSRISGRWSGSWRGP